MNEKYRKAFVTAHVVLRTARRHVPADVLNRGSHLPEILKMAPNIGGGILLFMALLLSCFQLCGAQFLGKMTPSGKRA